MGRILFVVLAPFQAAAPPPDTEIFLAPLTIGSGATVAARIDITNSPGYDNQPSFTPDGTGILFTSIRGGGAQTHIYRYDIAAAATARVAHRHQHEGDRIAFVTQR